MGRKNKHKNRNKFKGQQTKDFESFKNWRQNMHHFGQRELPTVYKPKEDEKPAAAKKEFDLSLHIEEEVFKKIMYWIHKSNFEVSGLGKVIYEPENNVIRVVSAILLPQKNTSTTTELDPAAVAKAMFLLKDEPGELKWWWHSHVNMNAFWSGTDEDTIKQLGSGGWFAATVLNKKEEMKSAFCQAAPVRMMLDDIETAVLQYEEEVPAEWDEEYEKNVENMKPTPVIGFQSHNNGVPSRSSYPSYPGFGIEDLDDEDIAAFIRARQRREAKASDKATDNLPPELADIYPREESEGDAKELDKMDLSDVETWRDPYGEIGGED